MSSSSSSTDLTCAQQSNSNASSSNSSPQPPGTPIPSVSSSLSNTTLFNSTTQNLPTPNFESGANRQNQPQPAAQIAQRQAPPPKAETSNNSSQAAQQQLKGPLCILTPCSNSHPFEERRIVVTRTEENAVKIGRSVVRLQPSSSNAIFDCKVLSRNHAILWLNEENQFIIKDTRSSNGTFINNERLSASGEESGPKEIFSGDILQLGVEIVDNTKKVASGCITCIVRLINDRNEECAGRSQNDQAPISILNEQQIPANYTLVRNDKIFMLDQYIKEAKFRENLLNQKLQLLEELLNSAQEALNARWDENINQELLLSRIELLESQLAFLKGKKGPSDEDKLRQELRELMEDRAKAEQIAKESLRAKEEQMQETSMRLHDAEMALTNVESECDFLRQQCGDFEVQLGRQREDYDALLDKYNEVCMRLSAAERAATSALVTNQQKQQTLANGETEESVMVIENAQQQKTADGKLDLVKPENGQQEVLKTGDGICWIEVPPPAEAIAAGREEAQRAIAEEHQCVETELRQRCDQLTAELDRLKSLMSGKATRHDALTTSEGVQHCSPADFQIFLLSALPFLLAVVLMLTPIFYFFGTSWLTSPPNIGDTFTNEPQKDTGEESMQGTDQPNQ